MGRHEAEQIPQWASDDSESSCTNCPTVMSLGENEPYRHPHTNAVLCDSCYIDHIESSLTAAREERDQYKESFNLECGRRERCLDQLTAMVEERDRALSELRRLNLSSEYRTISVKHGYEAVVDAADYVWLNQWSWFPQKTPHSLNVYARRNAAAGAIRTMHRIIMNPGPGMTVDHINGNTLDNRRCNLRLATVPQNQHNRGKTKNNTSGFKGVGWAGRERQWRAAITKNGRRFNLGYFDTPEEAHAAYCTAAKELHGEFARFN